MTRPLSLSDYQLRLVIEASRAIPVKQRDAFMQRVAAHLSGEPSDLAVSRAVNLVYDALIPGLDGTGT